jgi:putative peptidoglycan lipid II flippase
VSSGYNPVMDSPATDGTTANRQIARAAGTVMFAIIAGQVFSLLSSMLITRAFGTGMENEAFFAANRLPDILYNLVAGGALASAFIPTFTGLIAKGEREKAWLMASAIANLITVIFVIVGVLAAIFAPWVVHNILAPGFTDPVKFQLTVNLVRIQLAAPIIFGLSGLTMGILNSHQSFLWPALAPAMYSIGKILGVVLLVPSMGVYGLALGVVGGALMHGLIQLPSLLRLPMRKYTPTFGLRIPDVREVARLMGPRLLGVAFVQLNFLVNYRLASSQPLGSVTAITVAFSLMMIPEAAIAQAIAIAALPTFSAQVAKGQLAEMRSSLAALLRAILLLAVPASLGLILLARPIIAFIFERGAFDPHSTQLVTWALIWYAAGLVGHSIVEIVSRAFYALHDTKTPVFVGVAAMSLNVILSILFSRLFVAVGWMPHGGLALANSVATFMESFALLFFMRRRLSGLEGRNVLNGAWKALLAGSFMSASLWGWVWLAGRSGNWLITLGGMAVGVLVYTLALFALRTPELARVLGFVKRKLLPASKGMTP